MDELAELVENLPEGIELVRPDVFLERVRVMVGE